MTGQESILDFLAAQQAKQDAIERVGVNADPDWKVRAATVIRALARERDLFTTDDVWSRLAGDPAGTHEPRAMGALMTEAAKAGLIAATPSYVPSQRPKCHSRPVRVWRSLLAGDRMTTTEGNPEEALSDNRTAG